MINSSQDMIVNEISLVIQNIISFFQDIIILLTEEKKKLEDRKGKSRLPKVKTPGDFVNRDSFPVDTVKIEILSNRWKIADCLWDSTDNKEIERRSSCSPVSFQ